MIQQLPDIPRLLTAVAEWAACVIFLYPLHKRFSKYITWILFGVMLVGQCVLQTLAGEFIVELWIPGMIMNVVFMFAGIMLIAEQHVFQTIYWCAIAFVTAEFMAAFEWQISCYMIRNFTGGINIGIWICAFFIFALILMGIYYLEKKVGEIGKSIGTHQAITTMILAIIAFIMSNISFLDSQWNKTVGQQYSTYFIRTLVDLCVLIILYLQQWTMREQQFKDELSSIQNVLNLQYKQYLDFKESSEYISIQCHDLKHQIEALRGACNNEERETYLNEMENAIKRYNGQNVTGNAVLDTLFTRKKIYCLQHDIDFSITADGRSLSFLSVRDICTIMGNILDNAIEYASCLENSEERQIQGEIYQKDAFLMIRLENYYRGDLMDEKNIPRTTKTDKRNHGYGLKSVRYIVEKYNGSMTIRIENNWFVVRILIPITGK